LKQTLRGGEKQENPENAFKEKKQTLYFPLVPSFHPFGLLILSKKQNQEIYEPLCSCESLWGKKWVHSSMQEEGREKSKGGWGVHHSRFVIITEVGVKMNIGRAHPKNIGLYRA
jgi:hypothetical protein